MGRLPQALAALRVDGGLQAPPPGSVMMGAITLTSWARQEIFTTSALRRRVFSIQPTTSVSTSSNASSSTGRATVWYYVPHTTEFIEYLRSILGPVWTGEQTAAEVFGLSLFDWRGVGVPEFKGLGNYVRLFTRDPYFVDPIKVTVFYSVLAVFGVLDFTGYFFMSLGAANGIYPVWCMIFWSVGIFAAAVGIVWFALMQTAVCYLVNELAEQYILYPSAERENDG